ncbi:MAG: hypothetical protein WCB77_08455, partial [Pseudolabrys sp.]
MLKSASICAALILAAAVLPIPPRQDPAALVLGAAWVDLVVLAWAGLVVLAPWPFPVMGEWDSPVRAGSRCAHGSG